MPILNEEEAKRILQKVISLSQADECEANLNGSENGNIRYARNAVSTAGSQSNTSLVVQASFGKKLGVSTINEFDDASLEKVVRRAEELARLAPENPEFVSILGPQAYDSSNSFKQNTVEITADYRKDVAQSSITPAAANDLTAAGYFVDSNNFAAMMNSKGVFAYNQSTGLNFTVTMRSNDGSGSGWVMRDYSDVSKFSASEASQIAIDKALQSRNPQAIEPGKYTVILEPAASIDMLEQMFFNMGAREADEGRSFLSGKGGATKLGEKLFDERINLYSDPLHPEVPTATWAGDGFPLKRTQWIENGVVKNMTYTRYWAENKGVPYVPFPSNIIMEGGSASLEDMIKDTKKGILVTRMWYIREVDPQTVLYTGLTRDGTFYIENGQIKFPIKNMRFNESTVVMLNNIEAIGKQERVQGEAEISCLIPTLKVRDFTFTSLSDSI
ncbi:MAG TPA: peptidase C69 [Microscillaceae bacterium]|jgi:predicted Zn-dependent protease|nr:peptidase C69 [Microscillaceae bacterium]